MHYQHPQDEESAQALELYLHCAGLQYCPHLLLPPDFPHPRASFRTPPHRAVEPHGFLSLCHCRSHLPYCLYQHPTHALQGINHRHQPHSHLPARHGNAQKCLEIEITKHKSVQRSLFTRDIARRIRDRGPKVTGAAESEGGDAVEVCVGTG